MDFFMINVTFFLLAFFSTMAVMNIYFHIVLAKGGVLYKGRIKDAENSDKGFTLKIQLNNDNIVDIRISNKLEEKVFLKFIENNIGNVYDVLEIKEKNKIKYIHNGSYFNKGILFSIGSIFTLIIILLIN